jgi:hypothetical protein
VDLQTGETYVSSELTVKGDAESLFNVGKENQGASNADSSK